MNTQIVKTDKAGRKRYLESERRELLRKFGASGMTQAAFCRSNGLSGVTFSKWVRARGAFPRNVTWQIAPSSCIGDSSPCPAP